jgi:hypothetical protein
MEREKNDKSFKSDKFSHVIKLHFRVYETKKLETNRSAIRIDLCASSERLLLRTYRC